MNNRNRHMQYRKSIYRKRRIKTILILSISIVVIVFALFLIIGTALHKKTEKKDLLTSTPTTQTQEPTGLAPTPTIGAYALPLLEDGTNFSDRLRAIPQSASAVCINLNDKNGTLLYRSDLLHEISDISVAPDASSLESSVSSISSNDFYISSVLYITAFENGNDLLEDIDLAIWGAVACDALRQGVGDVLIVTPSVEIDDLPKLYALADRVHTAVPNGVIGFALPSAVLGDEQKTALLDELNKHFNYMALDTTEFTDEDDPFEYVERKTANMQLDLMYYKMRVILPFSSNVDEQQKYIEAVTKYNISNWQMLP